MIESIASESVLASAIKLYCESCHLDEKLFRCLTLRSLLCFGMIKLRQLEREATNVDFEKRWHNNKKNILSNNLLALHRDFITPELVRDKIERYILRAAMAKRRSRMLSKLMNFELRVKQASGDKVITFINGVINSDQLPNSMVWQGATIAEWDRMSIVLSHQLTQCNE